MGVPSTRAESSHPLDRRLSHGGGGAVAGGGGGGVGGVDAAAGAGDYSADYAVVVD